MPDRWLEDRVVRTRELIIAHEDAIEVLTRGGAQAYTLDTGQTRTSVTRAQLPWLQSSLSELEKRLVALEARMRGSGFTGRPGF